MFSSETGPIECMHVCVCVCMNACARVCGIDRRKGHIIEL